MSNLQGGSVAPSQTGSPTYTLYNPDGSIKSQTPGTFNAVDQLGQQNEANLSSQAQALQRSTTPQSGASFGGGGGGGGGFNTLAGSSHSGGGMSSDSYFQQLIGGMSPS